MTLVVTRRNFIKKSAGAALASGAVFMGFSKLALAHTTYSVNVTTQALKGWEQEAGVYFPVYKTVISGNDIRLGLAKAYALANDIEDMHDVHQAAVFAATGDTVPTPQIQLVSHEGPNHEKTPSSELQNTFVTVANPVVEAFSAADNGTSLGYGAVLNPLFTPKILIAPIVVGVINGWLGITAAVLAILVYERFEPSSGSNSLINYTNTPIAGYSPGTYFPPGSIPGGPQPPITYSPPVTTWMPDGDGTGSGFVGGCNGVLCLANYD